MKPKISVVTLGVEDQERAVRFYRDGLGLPSVEDKPPVVYFRLQGTWLAVFPRDSLAKYVNVDPSGSGFRGATLSCNVDSRDEVDATLDQAVRAGATLLRPATEFRWGGYAGWFADPDGHVWEIIWNPRPFMD